MRRAKETERSSIQPTPDHSPGLKYLPPLLCCSETKSWLQTPISAENGAPHHLASRLDAGWTACDHLPKQYSLLWHLSPSPLAPAPGRSDWSGALNNVPCFTVLLLLGHSYKGLRFKYFSTEHPRSHWQRTGTRAVTGKTVCVITGTSFSPFSQTNPLKRSKAFIKTPLNYFLPDQGSLVAQLVKNPPAMQETWVWSLGWEDPLKKGKATHSSILALRVPWTV